MSIRSELLDSIKCVAVNDCWLCIRNDYPVTFTVDLFLMYLIAYFCRGKIRRASRILNIVEYMTNGGSMPKIRVAV